MQWRASHILCYIVFLAHAGVNSDFILKNGESFALLGGSVRFEGHGKGNDVHVPGCRPLSTLSSDNAEECRRLCTQTTACTAINWSRKGGSGVCVLRSCGDVSIEMIRLDVPKIGWLSVSATESVSFSVEKFAMAAHAEGHKISRQLMQEMIEYFCRRRSCGRRGVRGMLSLRVDGIGVARSEPWEYPFVVVQRFAESAFRSGRGIDHHGMQEMLDWFCARSYCAQKDVPRDISLKVRGIGSMICKPWQDPADVVDEFLKAAFAAGYQIDDNDALRILDYFCERRYCRRKSLQQQNQSKESSQNSNMSRTKQLAMDNDIGNSREVRIDVPVGDIEEAWGSNGGFLLL